MTKQKLIEMLESVSNDTELVLQVSDKQYYSVCDFDQIQSLFRPQYGCYLKINNVDDFDEEFKKEIQDIIVLRAI